MKFTPLLVSSLLAGANAASIPSPSVHYRNQPLSSRWEKRDGLNARDEIPVRIALKQRNLHNGMDYLMEVSDPQSKKYGQHYTADEVAELFAPKSESVVVVKEWLIKSGVPASEISSTRSKGWLDFTTTVEKLEDLIGAKYHVYSHVNGNGHQITSESYSLPAEISEHVDFVHPAMSFSKRTKRSEPGTPKKITPVSQETVDKIVSTERDKSNSEKESTQYCADYVTPACIKALYGIPDGKLSDPSNRLGIYEDDDEFYQQSDLTAFYSLFATNIPSSVGPLVHLIDYNGKKPNPAYAGGEAALDFDMAQPILYPQSTVLFQTHDNFNPSLGRDGFFNQFLDAVDGTYCHKKSHNETGDDPIEDGKTPNEACGRYKPTNVVSFSYGWPESDYPAGYIQRQCDEFMKLGLQGTSLVFSSGDGGVAGGHGGDCLGSNFTIFNPQNAAACPYVTSVGSTYLPSGSTIGDSEVATSSFASGGGFSNVFPTPQYQQSAVAGFFTRHDPGFPYYSISGDDGIPEGKGVFNRGGRGYPDIAAIGDNGVIVFDGQVGRSGGTSMSAPIVASMFTRINDERIAVGKGPIGFANPALYANPKMFNDITIGDGNAGGEGACKGKYFKAVPGWDPVTGLGTPKYKDMLAYLMTL